MDTLGTVKWNVVIWCEFDYCEHRKYHTTSSHYCKFCSMSHRNINECVYKDLEETNNIALLGCGGYGLPLCNFIKMELGKSAIYIGGGLQLLFGVKGKRWENHPVIGKIIKDNGQFISPSGDEILHNNNRVEGGCYW